jgi:hypothetical protein
MGAKSTRADEQKSSIDDGEEDVHEVMFARSCRFD